MGKGSTPLWCYVVAALIVLGIVGGRACVSAAQPDGQGCATVREMNGWRECRLLDRKYVYVGMRGCSDKDGHAYEVAGTNAAGQPVAALVCCGALLKGCTVRSR